MTTNPDDLADVLRGLRDQVASLRHAVPEQVHAVALRVDEADLILAALDERERLMRALLEFAEAHIQEFSPDGSDGDMEGWLDGDPEHRTRLDRALLTALILSGHKRALVASELLQAAEEVSRG